MLEFLLNLPDTHPGLVAAPILLLGVYAVFNEMRTAFRCLDDIKFEIRAERRAKRKRWFLKKYRRELGDRVYFANLRTNEDMQASPRMCEMQSAECEESEWDGPRLVLLESI